MQEVALFIHRRDLRIPDNTALMAACKSGVPVLPCFIFDPKQIEEHPYRSKHALQFMLSSLTELKDAYTQLGACLYFFKDSPRSVVKKLSRSFKVVGVYVNEDYTPFAIQRDTNLTSENIPLHTYPDALLTAPGSVCTQEGGPYEVFTPFRKKAQKQKVSRPVEELPSGAWFTQKVEGSVDLPVQIVNSENEELRACGGREEGLHLLDRLKDLKDYKNQRDYPEQEEVSFLSAHHKFGTVSIRETYWKARDTMRGADAFINELYWRDFYTHIAFHFPKVFGEAFKEEYQEVAWDTDKDLFALWCEGKTGFPIVDAGMRELNTTGYMHNRVRMIVASFLTKDLHLPWQWGERYFATKLTDYDPAVNNGSWQWAASTGADGAPYFRIFNPWLQQKRFDPECVYIKKWVPELQGVSAKNIHKGEQEQISEEYPSPIVVHKKEAEEAKRRFKQI